MDKKRLRTYKSNKKMSYQNENNLRRSEKAIGTAQVISRFPDT